MDQGGVQLTVDWSGGQIVAARVECRRPKAAHLLEGRSVAEVEALAPRLFSLCGHAQGAAAKLATAAARGEDGAVLAEQLCRGVAREAIGEHLWRLLLDWPPLSGGMQEKETFLRWRKHLLSLRTPQEEALFARELLQWLPSLAEFPCPERAVAAPAQLLPWRDADAWTAIGVDSVFAAAPMLGGQPAETGPLARQAADPEVVALLADHRRVAARVAARRADLRFLAQALLDPSLLLGWLGAAPVSAGIGLARVETARGLLLHLTQVKDDRVEAYVIVAPTEWNFHPRGAFVGEIVGSLAATRDAAAMLARRLALALDPCVSCELVVEAVGEHENA